MENYWDFIVNNTEVLDYIEKNNILKDLVDANMEATTLARNEGWNYLHSYRYSKIYDVLNENKLDKLYTSKILNLMETSYKNYNKSLEDLVNDYKNDKGFFIIFWETELDRDQGYSSDYYRSFNSLDDAIKEAREFFNEGACASLEIINNKNEVYFCCDKESEDFYINGTIISCVDKELLSNYVNNWCEHKELPIKKDLLYCKEDDKFVAVDNSSGNCWTEEFKTEEEVHNWLLGMEETSEFEM